MNTYIDVLGLDKNYTEIKPVRTKTNSFIKAQTNKTFTENGALTNTSSLSKIVDWFFHGAALRKAEEKRILDLFTDAFKENPTSALRILFYIRDIRGGQGERRTFRICLQWLGNHEAKWLSKNLSLIFEYGRWDDYFVLFDTKLANTVIDFIGSQLEKDLKHHVNNEINNLSLLAKWMPSEASVKYETKKCYNTLIKTGKFGTKRNYRKAISILRKDLDIVERKLSAKEYSNIDYEKLPSYAMLKYSKPCVHNGTEGSFLRNDKKRFSEYLDKVNKGETKINAKTLYPYDLAREYTDNFYWNHSYKKSELNATVEAQWKALPDYVPEINGLVVCDTSGSMDGLPMAVAMSLAVYIAERNKSEVWKNYVIPFSHSAKFMEVSGETLLEKLLSIYTGDCSNTNLQAVFDLILNRAKAANVLAEDMPKQLLIISDMEFDSASFGYTNYEKIKRRYEESGYALPKLVWWNVDSRNTQTPVTIDDKNNLLLSGSSPSCLRIALSGEFDIVETINKIIEQERYSCINY